MADLKITDVPQGSSVATTDDFYIKTGNTFRRVPVSKLVTLLNTQGFYQKGLNGIPTTDLAEEQVVISPDGSGYVSSKTYSQISAAVEAGSAIHPEFRPDGSTYLRGMVLDILDSSALFAFLVPGTGPHISIFNVTDLTVTETRIPVSGQPCRAVCNTEEETTAKTAEVQGVAGDLFSLYDGATVYVYFTNGASPGSTLNVNNTGAKLIDFGGTTSISAGSYAQLFYHEALGNWILVGGNSGGGGLTDEAKYALLSLLADMINTTPSGPAKLSDLEDKLFPARQLLSITAAYEQDRPIYDSDSAADNYAKVELDLIVTAFYSDGTSEAVTNYTLSGTFTAGTSTITVSYGGKSVNISVLVLQNLDSIAYGELTYRDIFITNNIVPLGDFEEDLALTSSFQNYHGDSTKQYKINAGSPSQSSEACVSPTKSLKCFGSSSAQIQYIDYARTSGTYLACLSVNVSRYSAGKAGINVYFTGGVVTIDLSKNVVTDGWEQLVGTGSVSGTSPTLSVYIGSMSSANLDAYIDDVVITPLPGGLTTDAAMVLYKKYLELRGANV